MYFIFVVSFFIVDIFQYHVTEIFTSTSVILAFDKSTEETERQNALAASESA